MALAPADERIELTGFTTAPSATVTPHDPLPWLWGAIGLVAAGIVAWLATRGRPDLRSIEVALESGHYGKAARLSTRVLRKDPLQESAHLSRAIAWSRAGHPGRVLRAVGRFLERHDPTDGTLHYVLGLAHKDLGDDEAARQAIAEAVDRTPSLLMEVEPILRPARAFHSDAQAYT